MTDHEIQMEYHVIQMKLTDKDAIHAFICEQTQIPMDYLKPLWRFYLIQLDDGTGAVVGR